MFSPSALTHRRRMACAVLLLGVWALGLMRQLPWDLLEDVQAELHHLFHSHEAHTPETAALEIIVPGKPKEICEHHPEGCPKHCFCPKTLVHPEPSPVSETEETGNIPTAMVEVEYVKVPVLTECSEKRQFSQPSDAKFRMPPHLPAARWLLALPMDLGMAHLPWPLEPFPDTPFKVPITNSPAVSLTA